MLELPEVTVNGSSFSHCCPSRCIRGVGQVSSVSGAEVEDDNGVGVVGDVVEKAGFELMSRSSSRWGGVAKECTRTAV